MKRRLFLTFAAAAAATRAASAPPLAIVIPFAPGGASDVVVRTVADALAAEIGRPVVAENKGGAGGLLAASAVARAAPDGATLLYGNQGQIVLARHLFPGGGVDPLQALQPLTQTARTQFFLVTPSGDGGAAGVEALLQAGRRQPLRFGVPGLGTPPHLAAVLFGERAGLAIEVVPYQGSAPVLVDLIAGRLDAAFDNVASSLPHWRAGRLRALAVSGSSRAAVASEVPTVAEAGLPGYAYHAWQGVFAPRGMAAEAAAGLAAALQRSLAQPAVRQKLQESGLDIVTEGPAAFEALIARDAAFWEAAFRKGLIRPA